MVDAGMPILDPEWAVSGSGGTKQGPGRSMRKHGPARMDAESTMCPAAPLLLATEPVGAATPDGSCRRHRHMVAEVAEAQERIYLQRYTCNPRAGSAF